MMAAVPAKTRQNVPKHSARYLFQLFMTRGSSMSCQF